MIKVRYTTPTGALFTVDVPKPEKPLMYWQMKGYVRQELEKRNLEFKKFSYE